MRTCKLSSLPFSKPVEFNLSLLFLLIHLSSNDDQQMHLLSHIILLLLLISFILCFKAQDGEDRHDMRAVSSNVDLDEQNPYEEDERLLRVLHHVGGFTGIRNTWKQ